MKKEEMLFRSVEIRKEDIAEDNSVSLSFSSEEPVLRFYRGEVVYEVLDHQPDSVDLTRLLRKAPLLKDHDPNQQIGVVESVDIGADRKGRAVVRFSKNPQAQEVLTDVRDGIRPNVSFAYEPFDGQEDGEREGQPVYRFKWRPYEISSVSIPADTTVGVGRAFDGIVTIERKEETHQPDDTNEEPAEQILQEKKMSEKIEVNDQQRDIAADVEKILDLAEKHDAHALATKHVRAGSKLEDFVADLLENVANARKVEETPEIGMTSTEVESYSFLRAINALANPNDRKAREAAAFEFECSDAAQEKMGRSPNGMFVPFDVLSAKRDLTVGTASAGGNLKPTDHLGESFIDVLRSQLITSAMGARTLTGLVGDVAIPSLTAGTAAYWVTEGNAPTEGAPTFGQVTMAPKTVGAYVDISRKLLLQSSPDVEMLIMEDLAKNLAVEIDKKALYGTGSSGQPTGISQTSGINAPTAFAAATPTWLEVLAMLGAVAVDNALTGELGYVTDPATMAALMGKSKDTGSGQFVWSENNTVAGYKAMASSIVTSGDVFFGNWNDLIIGQWGGLDLNLDDKSLSTAGAHRVVALQDCDVAVRHAVSFAFNNDTV